MYSTDLELITEFDWKNAVNELGEQQQVAVAHDRISSVERRAGPDRFARGSHGPVFRSDMTCSDMPWMAGLLNCE